MTIQFREVAAHELDALLDLYSYLHATDAPLPDAVTLQSVWDDIVRDPKVHCLVGDLEGRLVASCILVIVPNLTRGARPYGLIENVITHPDHRRQGIGTRLLQHALDMAWAQQCYKVMLLTGRKDEAVFRFYENVGFKRGVKTGFIAYPGS
jgi:GNAT superfamily N-acetyltransferase